MKINRTLEQHRQYMNQFFDKVTVQNILTCFLTVVMILRFSLAPAHAETQVGGNITEDTIWTLAGSPYIVTNSITVRSSESDGSTPVLTVNPGVTVKFSPATSLTVGYRSYSGALSAEGAADSPITFTSAADTPAPGDWYGIHFNSATEAESTLLEHCVIEYGGKSYGNINTYGSPTVKNCTVRNSGNWGVYIRSGSLPVISDNVLTGNKKSAVFSYPEGLKNVTGNSGSENGKDHIEVSGDVRSDITWKKQPLPYGISASVTIWNSEAGSTATLTLEPGIELGFEKNTGIYIAYSYPGALSAQGTADSPITFTSAAEPPAPGDWYGIHFRDKTDDSLTVLENCVVEYAYNGLYYSSASPAVKNNTIRYSSAYPVSMDPETNNIRDNNCSGNGSGDAIAVRGGTLGSDTVWQKNNVPYLITDSITIRSSESEGSAPSLTVNPGVTVKFSPATSLTVGYRSYSGALSAEGTADSPITFTSAADTPAPGDWHGIHFNSATDAESTVIERCVIEYGGSSYGNINIYGSPTVRNCVIRKSGNRGVYIWSDSQPVISDNVFTGNKESAIYSYPGGLGNVTGNSGSGNGKDHIEVSGDVRSDITWKKQPLPYGISGSVAVWHSEAGSTATLTLEPGIELRFEKNTGIYIGYSYPGALSAQGTADSPITFTSAAEPPAPGDWYGINFRDRTDDTYTILENCVIEYGTYGINLTNAKPKAIQYNTIRNSNHSGIYVNGDGCDGLEIRCNNLKDNRYGIYTSGSQPVIHNNNFLRNGDYGIYNNSRNITIDGANNWWEDNGEKIYGEVDTAPQLTSESTCIALPPTNSPPFVASNPGPANNAVRVLYDSVTFTWGGGDPNPWDTVTYDVFLGTSEDSLSKIADHISEKEAQESNLEPGTIYFWQLVTRDDKGLETDGPVWQFTTEGPLSDLIVSEIVWNPASGIEQNQRVTFTASIQNKGAGPAVDGFRVDFLIDGSRIGTEWVSEVIPADASVQVNEAWYARVGEHSVEVVADSSETVAEYDEENNRLTKSLSQEVQDETLPQTWLASTPSGSVAICEAKFEICWSGSDDITPTDSLQYAYKLDSSEWSDWISGTCHQYSDLSDGDHEFQVRAKDASDNIDATPSVWNFSTDRSQPLISNIALIEGQSSVSVTWRTSKHTTSQVEYGPTDAYGSTTPLITKLETSHSVTITGLTQESDYHFQVKSEDACETEAVSDDQTFTTTPDTDLPETWITSGPSDTVICETDTEFCWTGSDSETATESLEYSYKMDDGEWSDWGSESCREYTDLSDASHTFQVRAKDDSGNVDETPATWNFTTDRSQTVISDIAVVERQSSASVTWSTSKKTTSQVEYGTTIVYGPITAVDNRKVGDHRVVVSELTPETTYHFRVISNDGCNDDVVSDDETFTTTAIQPPNLIAPYFNVPPSASPLTEAELRWRIRNDGQGDADGEWTDRVYLSSDDVLNDTDIILGEFTKTDGLTAYFDHWQTETVQIPDVTTGPYYIILKTDSDGTVDETDEDDNIAVRPIDITKAHLMTVVPDVIYLNLTPGVPATGKLDIGNIGAADISGIVAAVQDASANIGIQMDVPTTLESLNSQTFDYTVTANDASVLKNDPTVTFTSNEGVETSVMFKLNIIPGEPRLVVNPSPLETGMLRGRQRMFEFDIFNTGGAPANSLMVLLPDALWLKLVTPKHIDKIESGGKATVGLMLNPSEDLPLGPYTGDIVLSGNNATLHVGFKFNAVSEAKGDLKVTVTDEFTYFAEDKPNVAGATIVVKDVFENTVIAEGVTDATGIFLTKDIPEGHYNLEIMAEKHSPYSSTIQIVPGEERDVEAFLSRQMVTYSWNVEPVEVEDNYRVTLEAEFETHVPMPVVTVEPKVQLVPIFNGETSVVNVTVTNHGLIETHDVTLDFNENEYYHIEPLIRNAGTLSAMSSITIPVMIREKDDGTTDSGKRKKRANAKFSEKWCDFLSGKVTTFYYCGGDAKWHEAHVSIKPLKGILAFFSLPEVLAGLSGDAKDCAKKVLKLKNFYKCLGPDVALFPECQSIYGLMEKMLNDFYSCLGASCSVQSLHDLVGAENPNSDPCACMFASKTMTPVGIANNLLNAGECLACSEELPVMLDEWWEEYDKNNGGNGSNGSGGLWTLERYLQFEEKLREAFAGYSPSMNLPHFSPVNRPLRCNLDEYPGSSRSKPQKTKTGTETEVSDITKYGGRIIKYNVIGGN